MANGRSPNPFLYNWHRVANPENLLTEFIAGALVGSANFRRGYAAVALARYAKKKRWPKPVIDPDGIRVQWSVGRGRVDMRLLLHGGRTILCEHKISAQETISQWSDAEPSDRAIEILERRRRDQLVRYLEATDADGVLYVRADLRSPGKEVLKNDRYIRPANESHFMWSDFYPAIKQAAATDGGVVLKWLQDGFDRRGYTPATLELDLNTKEGQKEFTKNWRAAADWAVQNSWRQRKWSRRTLMLEATSPSGFLVSDLSFRPFPTLMRIRLTPRRPQLLDQVEELVRKRVEPTGYIVEQIVRRVKRVETVADAFLPLPEVVGKNPKLVQKKLKDLVVGFVGLVTSET